MFKQLLLVSLFILFVFSQHLVHSATIQIGGYSTVDSSVNSLEEI